MSTTTKAAPAASDEKELLISGSEAVAEGLTLADIDVVTGYPIRPYDTVIQAIAKKISNGQLVAEYIVAEGEHSQFEIVKHASTVGARVFCGSSGVGWAYAMECLVVTPPLRVPMVCLVGNRALDDPGAFGVEHNDAMTVRDLGWLLCWVTTPQEALEHVLIGYRIAEDKKGWLFRTSPRHSATVLTDRPMKQDDAWRMVRRRALAAGILAPIGNHTFRATGITHETGKPEAVIEKVLPRATVLTRADSFKGQIQHPIVANAQQMLIVVSLAEPTVTPPLTCDVT